jgi:hypothetical protein
MADRDKRTPFWAAASELEQIIHDSADDFSAVPLRCHLAINEVE